jgi:hypothetical protein
MLKIFHQEFETKIEFLMGSCCIVILNTFNMILREFFLKGDTLIHPT